MSNRGSAKECAQQNQPKRFSLATLGPVGLLNPFLSPSLASGVLDREYEAIAQRTKIINKKMLDDNKRVERGDKEALLEMARNHGRLRIITNMVSSIRDRLSIDQDFQSQQIAKFTDAFMTPPGFTYEEMQVAMRWFDQFTEATASGRTPPLPPPKVAESMVANNGIPFPSYGVLGDDACNFPTEDVDEAERAVGYGPGTYNGGVRAMPFLDGSPALSNQPLRTEHDALARESRELAARGAEYGRWGRAERLKYLDSLEAVEGRWTALVARAGGRSALNPEFVRQARSYRGSLGIHYVDQYSRLVRAARDLMRAEAMALAA